MMGCFGWLQERLRNRAGRLAQLVEHRLYTPAVTGSSPVPPTISGLPFGENRRSLIHSLFALQATSWGRSSVG